MRDSDIRTHLVNCLERKHNNDTNTLIIQELGLCQGDVRVDLAVVNGSLHGYEIKSDKDTLRRLAGQLAVYGKVLDFGTLVASHRHISSVIKNAPAWWAICEAHYEKGNMEIVELRPGLENDAVDATALVQLLWRDESLEILKEHKLHKGFVDKPRRILWQRITECLSLNALRAEVRNRIKARQNWRVASQQVSYDG